MSFYVPEELRVRKGDLRSETADGNNGFFLIPGSLKRPYALRCIASDGSEWVDLELPPPRMGTRQRLDRSAWEEMCLVKSLFWDAEDVVWQLHPPKSEYVNNHPYCLHLWRPIGIALQRPPAITVGIA
jgi:hypothetical protein